jgi:hypothetical protein
VVPTLYGYGVRTSGRKGRFLPPPRTNWIADSWSDATNRIGFMRNLVGVVALLIVGLGGTLASAQTPQTDLETCSSFFPEQPWTVAGIVAGVSVETADIEPTLAARLLEDVAASASGIAQDIAPLDGASVCIFNSNYTVARHGVVGEGQEIRAAAFLPEGIVVHNVAYLKEVDDGAAYGLTRIALWRRAAAAGESGFPEPLGSFIAGRNVAAVTDSMRAARNVDSSILLGRPPLGWVVAEQRDALAWNPSALSQFGGGFMDWAIAEFGIDVINERDPQVWDANVEEFLAQMRFEATGSRAPSGGWELGVMAFAASIVLTAITAFGSWYPKMKERRRRKTKRPPEAGYFESM